MGNIIYCIFVNINIINLFSCIAGVNLLMPASQPSHKAPAAAPHPASSLYSLPPAFKLPQSQQASLLSQPGCKSIILYTYLSILNINLCFNSATTGLTFWSA